MASRKQAFICTISSILLLLLFNTNIFPNLSARFRLAISTNPLRSPPCPPRSTPINPPPPPCSNALHRASTFLLLFNPHTPPSAISTHLTHHSQVHLNRTHPPLSDPDPLRTARQIFNIGTASGLTTGLLATPRQILSHPAKWASLLQDFNTRIIWHHRRNIFKTAVTVLNRNRLLNATGSTRPKCSFQISDMHRLHTLLQTHMKQDADSVQASDALQGGRGCLLRLAYEDSLCDPEKAMRRVNSFLGLSMEIAPPSVDAEQVAGEKLCQVVENWREVCANFYGCAVWRPMMEDVANNCTCQFTSGSSKYCGIGF